MFFSHIHFCIKEINHLKRKDEHKFTVIICYTAEKSCVEITNSSKFLSMIKPSKPKNKEELFEYLGTENYTITTYSSK